MVKKESGKKKRVKSIEAKRTLRLTFSGESYKQLAELQGRLLDNPTKGEVVGKALGVLSWLIEELEAGHSILVKRKPTTATELGFPYLRIKQNSSL